MRAWLRRSVALVFDRADRYAHNPIRAKASLVQRFENACLVITHRASALKHQHAMRFARMVRRALSSTICQSTVANGALPCPLQHAKLSS